MDFYFLLGIIFFALGVSISFSVLKNKASRGSSSKDVRGVSEIFLLNKGMVKNRERKDD